MLKAPTPSYHTVIPRRDRGIQKGLSLRNSEFYIRYSIFNILFSISSKTPSPPPPKRRRKLPPVDEAKGAGLCTHKTKKAVGIFYLPTAYIKRKNRINQ